MKKLTAKMERISPMALFWMGVLTGALVVGLAFLYKGVSTDGDAALLRYTTTSATSASTYATPSSFMVPPPYKPM